MLKFQGRWGHNVLDNYASFLDNVPSSVWMQPLGLGFQEEEWRGNINIMPFPLTLLSCWKLILLIGGREYEYLGWRFWAGKQGEGNGKKTSFKSERNWIKDSWKDMYHVSSERGNALSCAKDTIQAVTASHPSGFCSFLSSIISLGGNQIPSTPQETKHSAAHCCKSISVSFAPLIATLGSRKRTSQWA